MNHYLKSMSRSFAKNATAAILFISLFASTSQATVIHHGQNNVCIQNSIIQVHRHLINYESYRSLDNAGGSRPELTYPIGPTSIRMIDMTLSETRFHPFTTRPGFTPGNAGEENTDALVFVQLVPYQLTVQQDQDKLPRFYLHCQSRWTPRTQSDTEARAFTHTCQMRRGPYTYELRLPNGSTSPIRPDPIIQVYFPRGGDTRDLTIYKPYGLENFASEVHARQATANDHCGTAENPGTILRYSFDITPNDADVATIKNLVVARIVSPILQPFVSRVIAPLFDTDNHNNFYLWYYRAFYQRWLTAAGSATSP